MNQYTVVKVFNNNAVMVKKQEKDYILVGKGIGFSKKAGEAIDSLENIENVFILLDDFSKAEYESLFSELELDVISVVEDILKMASDSLKEKLHPHTRFGLMDHINFSIKRMREGINIVNPFLLETKLMYPKEFSIAMQAVELIEKKLLIEVPESEVGFIALHIHGGRLSNRQNSSLKHVKLLSKVISYLEDKLKIKIEEESFNTTRFISHIRGVIERCSKGKNIENVFLEKLKKDFVFEYKIAENIAFIIQKNIGFEVPESEVGYIALHIYKMNNVN